MNPSHIREKKEMKPCIFVFFVQLLLYVSNSENKKNDKLDCFSNVRFYHNASAIWSLWKDEVSRFIARFVRKSS